MTKWESEREFADKLRNLAKRVRQLQTEIHDHALASKKSSDLVLPTEDERRLRNPSTADNAGKSDGRHDN